MHVRAIVRGTALPSALLCCVGLAAARQEPPSPDGVAGAVAGASEEIEVTATREPEDPLEIPASVSVVTGAELAARGVTDLPSALALVAGVTAAPGGDAGPAGSVPELWGLREFDAFLLVVDGVPWGGAFVPALTAVDMNDVERIEVLRGAAPVMYGATSFVGVIHVIHRKAGAEGRLGRAWGGGFGSYGLAYGTPLPGSAGYRHSVSADYERRGFKPDRVDVERAHARYRGAADLWGGEARLDVDLLRLRQRPGSPHPRQGTELTPLVPLDANHNPSDARIDDDRSSLTLGYVHRYGRLKWETTLAATRTERDTTRGFLVDLAEVDPNAVGYRQDAELTDAYFDTHVFVPLSARWDLVAGLDHIYGRGEQRSTVFDYVVPLDGQGAPSSSDQPAGERSELLDTRNFSGLYAQLEWRPVEALRIEAGGRLNRTSEELEGEAKGPGGPGADERARDEATFTRGSGVVGVSGRVFARGASALWLFADWRDTFKPAVVDFGPEAEGEILEPETAESWEAGIKGRLFEGRLAFEATGFRMDMENVVVSQAVDGVPVLVNAGRQRFEGADVEASYRLGRALRLDATFARHESTFRDYLTEFDGVPTQLAGNRLEMVPRTLASAGVTLAPERGLTGYVTWAYTGERFLNKRNTALADAFSTWSAGAGYRFGRAEVRVDGWNLSDARDPVAESELGDAQYYRQPARTWAVTLVARY